MTAHYDARKVRDLIRATPAYPATLHEFCTVPGRGIELLEHCPALAVLAARAVQLRPWEERTATLQRFASLSWRELLIALGLPARPRTIRILGKVPRGHCRIQTLDALRRILVTGRHRWVHVLPHLTTVTKDSVALLRLDPSLVTPDLLRASTESDEDEETVTWLLTSIRTLLLQLGYTGPWPYGGVGFERLKLLEGELLARLSPDPTAFPAPPFPGFPGKIEPVGDLYALARETESQANCVVSLLPEILEGVAFVYAVLHPERATLCLRRTSLLAEWQLHDLRAARNAAPAPATLALVRVWFTAAKRESAPNN